MLNDPLVALQTTDNLQVKPIWIDQIDDIEGPLYLEHIASSPLYCAVYVRSPIARMLQHAAQLLPQEYRLIVRAGHRPLSVQLKLLEMVKQKFLASNPGATDAAALEFARIYVSDPKVKQPPHCCGAAVDVDVELRSTGQLLDFGCPMNTDDEIAFLHSALVSKQQMSHRLMLVKAMAEAGFAPFEFEWWHFSYGDTTWAQFYSKKVRTYGMIEPTL